MVPEAAAAVAAAAASADPCAHGPGSGEGPPDVYDLGLHVAAIGIMLAVSLAGALAPVALRLSSSGPRVGVATKLGTYFGFGTILATALIHMLPPAAESLSSPCLPPFFRGGYNAWAYLFVMLAMMGMHLIDYLIKGHYRRQQQQQQQHAHSHGDVAVGGADGQPVATHEGCEAHHVAVISALVASKSRAQQPQAEAVAEAAAAAAAAAAEGGFVCSEEGEDDDSAHCCEPDGLRRPLLRHTAVQQAQQAAQQASETSQIIGLMLTEAGIIFHSVMIGTTLGVTGGVAFLGLLAALCLHQFFEGFAIGSAAVDSGLGAARSAAMGLAYSVTTPAGMAVGIAVRESFNQNAAGALLAAGICDAVSAGVLIYVVLVGLVTPMMTDSHWLRTQRWPLQVAAFAAFYFGAGVMALLGRWA